MYESTVLTSHFHNVMTTEPQQHNLLTEVQEVQHVNNINLTTEAQEAQHFNNVNPTTEAQEAKHLNYYIIITITICLFGIPGNLIIIKIMRGKGYNKMTHSIICVALAIINSAYLLYLLF